MTSRSPTAVKRTIEIELLALDLATCDRCTGTARNLAGAVDAVASLLRETGTDVRVTRQVVTTAEQAKRLRFAASPTIRIDGRNIAPEFKQSNCNDCSELCGCQGGVECRVWIWNGQEHLEAPRALIIDALLKAYANEPPATDAAAFQLPENLRRFFANTAQARQADPAPGTSGHASDCCDRATCCDEDPKAGCCEDAAANFAAVGGEALCGCR